VVADPTRDEAAFRALYQRTAPRIHAYARTVGGWGEQSDDVVQETFLRYLAASPPPMTENQTMAYLYKIATRLTINRWRARGRERRRLGMPAEDAALENVPAEIPAPAISLDMERALARLKARDRALLWLVYVEGQSHREAARVMEISEPSVRVHLFRARRRLAGILEEAGLAPAAP
jgi:RNA polymerase sigma-70 factor (ECF subfamily)